MEKWGDAIVTTDFTQISVGAVEGGAGRGCLAVCIDTFTAVTKCGTKVRECTLFLPTPRVFKLIPPADVLPFNAQKYQTKDNRAVFKTCRCHERFSSLIRRCF